MNEATFEYHFSTFLITSLAKLEGGTRLGLEWEHRRLTRYKIAAVHTEKKYLSPRHVLTVHVCDFTFRAHTGKLIVIITETQYFPTTFRALR